MDDHIFSRLDRLERSARVTTRSNEQMYNSTSAEYAAYDGQPMQYDVDVSRRLHRPPEDYDLIDEPMTLDSFGMLHLLTRVPMNWLMMSR